MNLEKTKLIQAHIHSIADEILTDLGEQTADDPFIGVAALALAMCALARVQGIDLSLVRQAVEIAGRQVSGTSREWRQ